MSQPAHVLRASVSQFGTQCVLSIEVIDLRLETSVFAKVARSTCEVERYLDMSAEVARAMRREN